MSRALPRLTYRKLTILLQLETGKGYKEIAEALEIHPETVRAHVVEIAVQLPGNGPPQDRVLLWCDRLLCAHADIVGHLRGLKSTGSVRKTTDSGGSRPGA